MKSGSLGDESRRTPRNAVAVVHLEKPQRSIKLRWEAPEIIPKYYEIEAIPETGKHKIRQCETITTIFPRLKTFTKYQFHISAVFDDEERHSCLTKEIQTYARLNQSIPAHFQNLSGTKIDQSNSSITNTTQLLSARLDSFDKVENMKMDMASEEGQEMAWVTWNHPSFSGFYDDYEIIQYRVEVFQLSTRVFHDFYKYEKWPRTQKFGVELGETYIIRIQITYEELDSEKTLTSNSETVFLSRPTYPMIEHEMDCNHLLVTWGSSIGAEKFRLKISHKTTGKVIKTEEGEKDFRKMTFKIDKEVFRGVEYTVSVTGIGKHGGVSKTTKVIIIGNEWAPRLPKVSLNEDDPLHAVDISWERSERNPYKYIIISTVDSSVRQEVNDTRCTVRLLKAGTKYRFNIFAIFTEKLEHEYKCTTEEITMNPCFGQRVDTLDVCLSNSNPESEISVNWEKVDNVTEYRVSVSAGKLTIEYVTELNYYTVHGLEPNTEYLVGVSAGKDQNFGEELTEKCRTAIKPPKEVVLSSSASSHVSVRWKGESLNHEVRLHNAEDGTLVKKTNVEGSTNCEFKGLMGNIKYFVDIEAIGPGTSNRKLRSDVILTVPPVKSIETLCNLENEENLSTDVYLEWQKDQGSLAYDIEVKTEGNVENLLRVEDVNSHQYRCLKPGSLYDFRLRAVNSSGHGRWSTSKTIQLQNPAPPKNITVVLDKEKPWEIANISWERPDNIPLFKIQIQSETVVKDWVQRENSYCVELGKPLEKYEISIFSGHENGVFSSEPVKRTFKMGELEPPSHILVTLDETDPWHIAHVKWPELSGVTAYKVRISDLESVTDITQDKSYYKHVGKPNTTCKVMVHPGDGRGFFSARHAISLFRLSQIPKVDEETLLLKLSDDGAEVILSWERPYRMASFKIKWYGKYLLDEMCKRVKRVKATNDCNDCTAVTAEDHVTISFKERFNTICVNVASICGNDVGPYTTKTFQLRPMVSAASVYPQFGGKYLVDVASHTEFDKMIIRAIAKTGDDGDIEKEFHNSPSFQSRVFIDLNLKPGERYHFYLKLQQGIFCSHELDLGHIEIPYRELQNLRVTAQSEQSVTAEWDCPEIKPSGYRIHCYVNPSFCDFLNYDSRQSRNEAVETKVLVTNLCRGCEYTLAVSPNSADPIDAKVVFRTAPRKLQSPKISFQHSSKEVQIVWNRSRVADQYEVILHELGSEIQEIKQISEHQTKDTCFTLKELSRGLKYRVMVRGMNEAGSGELSDALEFSTEFKAPEIASRIIELSKPVFKSRLPSYFVKPILKTENGNFISLNDFIDKNCAITSVIHGYPHSGLTSLCYYVANVFSDEKIVLLLQGVRNFCGTMNELLAAHLRKALKLHLNEIEISIFVKWMEENSHRIVFAIDNVAIDSRETFQYATSQTSMLYSTFIQQLLIRHNFTNSTVIATVSVSSRDFIRQLEPENIVFLDSYDTDSMHKYLENCSKIGIANWMIVESYSRSLCASARSCFTLANLTPGPKLDYSSPASVYLHVYRALYQEEKTKRVLAQEIKICTTVSKLHAIDCASFEDLMAHEMFLLAMHAVFFFKKDFFQKLMRTERHFNFTLLCVGLLNPNHSELALSLLSPEMMENAASLCQHKHSSASVVASAADKRIQAELGVRH